MTTALMSLLLSLFAAGCAGSPDTEPGGPAGSDTPGSGQVQLLVWYQRQGGLAGLSHQLVVQTDGSYMLTGRGRTPETGKLSTADLTELRRALESVDLAAIPSYSPPRIADGFTHTVRHAGHEVVAGDGNIPGALNPAIDILDRILKQHSA